MQTTATQIPGGWALSGRKLLVAYAGLADKLLVSARFGPSGQAGLVLIDPNAASVARRPHVLFDLASRADEVVFDSVQITVADVLGAEPSAAALRRLLDAGPPPAHFR